MKVILNEQKRLVIFITIAILSWIAYRGECDQLMKTTIVIIILFWLAYYGKCGKCGAIEFDARHGWVFLLGFSVSYWLFG